MIKSRAHWKWTGYAGHLCVASRCAYHLCTLVRGHLISTVGHYLPKHSDKIETIAWENDYFETMVFRCKGEDKNGDPDIISDEIETKRYADSITAEKEHYKMCVKYDRKSKNR